MGDRWKSGVTLGARLRTQPYIIIAAITVISLVRRSAWLALRQLSLASLK